MTAPRPLEGKVALITGGGRGLGRAIALALNEAGAQISVAARSAGALGEVVETIEDSGGRAIAVPTDITSEDDVERMASRTVQELGTIDILVNNSGVLIDAPLVDTTPDAWRHVIDTNLTGTYLCCRAVAPTMMDRGSGKVINIASMFGRRGVPRLASYAASKAAVMSLTASLALEWARFGIQVNAIAPGYFETDMNSDARGDEEIVSRIKSRIPARRMGRPEELGPLCVLLGSSGSDFMTGETITIDGGQVAG